VIPALARLEGWFSEEERSRCPFCAAQKAIEEGPVLVCLACAAVSLSRPQHPEPPSRDN
jgi:hypothetical protein